MPNNPRDFQAGPEVMPRNRLADYAREYGLYGLSDKLNSPTSGLGLAVDAVGGLGNALFVQPAQSFNRLLTQGYESGNPQSAEDAFNVAGAAMVGGLAAPRPRAAVAPKEQPMIGYRGSAYGGKSESPTYWASNNADTAADYASVQNLEALRRPGVTGPSVTPAEFRFNNPLMIDAAGGSWWSIPHKGEAMSTDNIARLARRDGHDGLVVNNVTDGVFGGGGPQTQTTIAALQPGTVYSPLTGDLLYAGGGRPGAAVGAAANAAAERPGIRAYHGSPHDFDRFDMSKIGTGEGAQAYGHGLYFAENEGVAKSYRETLGTRGMVLDGQPFEPSNYSINEIVGKFKDDLPAMRQNLDLYARAYEGNPYGGTADARRIIDAIDRKSFNVNDTGKLYEVRINASPDDFLDWDKPLSQQSEKVRGALGTLGVDTADRAAWKIEQSKSGKWNVVNQWGDRVKTVADREAAEQLAAEGTAKQNAGGAGLAYTRLGGNSIYSGLDKGTASAKLREAGVPGIKYLDQGSRGAGEGSRNYVVFDDALVEILRKYGLIGMLGAGATYAGSDAQASPSPSRTYPSSYPPGTL